MDADIVDEFDIGYIQNNTVVSLRSPVQEVWSSIVKGDNVTLWCDGLHGKESPRGKSTKKRSNKSVVDDCDDDEDIEVTKKKKKKKSEEREKKVEDTMEQLQSMHAKMYTQMQYRVSGSEMYVGGVHSSLDEPPTTTMFARAGGVQPKKKSNSVSEVLTHAVTQIASALTPRPGPSSTTTVTGGSSQAKSSPAKTIESRSWCYRQLGEIKALYEYGLLSELEYQSEREAIMSTLKNL